MHERGVDLDELAAGDLRSNRKLDELLYEKVGIMFNHGGGRSDASELLNAVGGKSGRFPWLRRHLPQAWSAIGIWEELEPVQHHRPLPLLFLHAILGRSLFQGHVLFALCVYLGFVACLRPGEIYRLLKQHISTPQTLRRPGSGFVAIVHPKRRHLTSTSRQQHVSQAL